MTRSVTSASAPASSANLGPGFDTLALALDLRCEVRAEPASSWSIRHQGPEPYLGRQEDDAILAAARKVSRQPLRVEVSNRIPLCRGLGSSAAAYAAGALAALRANGNDPGHDDLFQCVRELEGHPDNAAAAVYGGLVAVVDGSVIHPPLSSKLVPVVAAPGFELRTKDSRKVIPRSVPVEATVRTIGRVAALLEGLRTGSPDLLDLAGGDEIHEAPRTAHSPHTGTLITAALEAGALHACLSGAGPSVLCLTDKGDAASLVESLRDAVGPGGRVMILRPDAVGAR